MRGVVRLFGRHLVVASKDQISVQSGWGEVEERGNDPIAQWQNPMLEPGGIVHPGGGRALSRSVEPKRSEGARDSCG